MKGKGGSIGSNDRSLNFIYLSSGISKSILMFKNKYTFGLLLILALGFTSSCKYEEGPFISLRTKKERVANTWQVEKIIQDDGDEFSGDDVPDTEYTFTKDGKFKVDGNHVGSWEFTNSKEKIRFEFAGGSSESEILKLKEKELWVENDDGDETHYEPA